MPSAAAMAIAARLPWCWNRTRMREVEVGERVTRTREVEVGERVDILSALPDSLIGHIFSFLSIKDVLRTTAVSRRWNFLWTLTPTVSIQLSITSPEFFKGFSSSLERVLSQCLLARFEIEGIEYQPCRVPVFDFWLSSAVTNRIPNIKLTIDDYPDDCHYHALPVFFFANPSVANLCLQRCDFSLCHRVSWDSLRVLRVGEVEMTDRLLDTVLNGTPALECLELAGCWGMNHIRLCSNKLTELVIDGYGAPSFRSLLNDGDDTLVISAPHLLSLQIINPLIGKTRIRLHQVTSLVQATLDFIISTDKELSLSSAIHSSTLIKELSHVDNLVIGTWLLMMLYFYQTPTTIRLNCHTLTVGGFLKEWEFLVLITSISCGRDVEKLVIQFMGDNWPARYDPESFESLKWPGRRSAWGNWRNHLKTIEINGFRSEPTECGVMIRFLLSQSVVLEKMVVNNARGSCIYKRSPHFGI